MTLPASSITAARSGQRAAAMARPVAGGEVEVPVRLHHAGQRGRVHRAEQPVAGERGGGLHAEAAQVDQPSEHRRPLTFRYEPGRGTRTR
ncbi:hypothetical protein [Nonomuraea salmonea]|uniref:hypothetical protein n=1 Tax=Nonomuraea salmonea TaxID=46181 RepID=UPI0031EB4DB3